MKCDICGKKARTNWGKDGHIICFRCCSTDEGKKYLAYGYDTDKHKNNLAPNAEKRSPMNLNTSTMNLSTKVGLVASIALFVSTFMPVSYSPEIGTRLFISYTFVEGSMKLFPVLVIMSSIASFFFVPRDKVNLLWVSSFVGLVCILYPFSQVWETVNTLQDGYIFLREISPSRAIGLEPPGLEFGWGLLIISALLVVASAAMKTYKVDSDETAIC